MPSASARSRFSASGVSGASGWKDGASTTSGWGSKLTITVRPPAARAIARFTISRWPRWRPSNTPTATATFTPCPRAQPTAARRRARAAPAARGPAHGGTAREAKTKARLRERDVEPGPLGDVHAARCALDRDALARQLVEAPAADLDRRDHRRDLLEIAGERHGCGAQLALGHA